MLVPNPYLTVVTQHGLKCYDDTPFGQYVAGYQFLSGIDREPGGGHTGSAQADYGSMSVPSVWRTNRTQAAAKVDALSSGGMDDFEIPAFLRKQAD